MPFACWIKDQTCDYIRSLSLSQSLFLFPLSLSLFALFTTISSFLLSSAQCLVISPPHQIICYSVAPAPSSFSVTLFLSHIFHSFASGKRKHINYTSTDHHVTYPELRTGKHVYLQQQSTPIGS